MQTEEFKDLIEKYLGESIRAEEKPQLLAFLQNPDYVELLDDMVYRELSDRIYELEPDEKLRQSIHRYLGRHIKAADNAVSRPDAVKAPPLAARRIPYFKTAWVRYAAAIILVLGAAIYLWLSPAKRTQELAGIRQSGHAAVAADIVPGSDRAVLTLSDGRVIQLDSATNGVLLNQGGTQVVKLTDGTLAYRLSAGAESKMVYNTMETHRGGKYRLILPDGSKVWLNSASSIRYPNVFAGSERNVEIKGEAYFEIAQDASKPFKVSGEGMTVQVLGTEFNMMIYGDEEAIQTTLVNGSVLISGKGPDKLLKPGEQLSVVNTSGKTLVSKPDMEEVLAWKNGLFNFNNADIYTVMRQLSRWYDIDVKYEGKAPVLKISGKMDRGLNLPEILEFLAKMEIKFRMDGRTIVVTGT